jgi:hypothetical protein
LLNYNKENGRDQRKGDVANPNKPTFALSDFDETLWQLSYLVFKRFIKPKTKKTKPIISKK